MISQLFSPVVRASSYTRENALIDLTRAENKPADAKANFQVITGSLRPNEDLKEATDSFLGLLHRYGNGATDEVQDYYKRIGGGLREGESRLDATRVWLHLDSQENKPADTQSGYACIEARLDSDEERAGAASDYERLLKTEGNGATDQVQSHYDLVNKSRRPGESRAQAMEQFIRQYQAENKVEDAVANYRLVDSLIRPGQTRAEATTEFQSLLNFEGNGATDQVQDHFRAITAGLSAAESRSEAIELFKKQVRAENQLSDAEGNYKLVQSSLKPGETRAAATEQFLRVLAAEGNGNTDDTRADFETINRLVSDERPRAQLTDSFLRLLAETHDGQQAREMFLLAHS